MENVAELLQSLTQYEDVGLFVMRVFLGAIFIHSGSKKIKNVKGFAERNELPIVLAFIVLIFEFFGGIGLVLGVLTQIAAIMIMCVMAGAISFHTIKWHSPFWAQKGGWEYDLMLFLMALVTLLTGGGSLALYPSL